MLLGEQRNKRVGHRFHPLLAHFPMALLSITILWDTIGFFTGRELWWEISFWSLVAGLSIGTLTLVTGLMDSASISKDGPQEQVMVRHMYAMLCATAIYLGDLLSRIGHPIPTGGHLAMALILSVTGFLALIIGGWYGGELVYRYHAGDISE